MVNHETFLWFLVIPLIRSLAETKVFLKTQANGFAQNHLSTILQPFRMVLYNTPAKWLSIKPLYGSEKCCRCKTFFEPFRKPFVLTVYNNYFTISKHDMQASTCCIPRNQGHISYRSPVVANFLLKFSNFPYHGNRGRSETNFAYTGKFANPGVGVRQISLIPLNSQTLKTP